MTAEPDLPINDAVPAPTKIEPGNQFLWNWRQMQVYAQACVAHATAAKNAEIEALRAEVEMLRDAFSDDDMTAGAHWFGRYVEQKRRAERLAEANEKLRHAGALLSNIAYNLAQDDRLPDGMRWSLDDARKRWDAALNRAALEQESNDA